MSDQGNTPAENEIVQGGPGITPPVTPEPVATTRKKVKISGSEFEVDDAIAAALESREAEFQRKLSEQSEELGQARQRLSQYTVPVESAEPKDEDEELAVLLFEKPKEAVKKIRQSIRKEVETAYQQDQGQREFWSTFAANYPELRNALWVAKQVLSNNFNAWSTLTVAESMKRLAVATKEQISALNEETTTEEDAQPRTRVESTRTPAPPKPTKTEDKEQVGTPLTTLIARRREARRKAMLRQS